MIRAPRFDLPARLAGAALLLTLSTAALADGDATAAAALGDRYYVAPMFSYVLSDSDRHVENGYGGTLAIGRHFGEVVGVEATGFYNRYADSDRPGGGGASEQFGGGLALMISAIPALRDLYAIGSVQYGVARQFPLAGDYDGLLYSAGLGYLFQVSDHGTALRLEALYRIDSHKSGDANGQGDYGDTVLNLGLMFPFGERAAEVPASAAPPVAVVPVAAGDSDGDGVVDRLDRCPGTPPGTTVDASGCPVAAPATCRLPAAGERIDLSGCAAGDTLVLQGVNFEFDQARLTADARGILDGVASALVARPDIRVEVGGHTDSRGADDYNQKLSQQRAESVRQYLVGHGVDAGRMSARGYGETQPVADNGTDEGRERNRRVELRIQP